jgi:hypothetical protein
MKKAIYFPVAVMVMILVNSISAQAWHGGHGGHFGGSIWIGPGWGPGWWGPPYYYAEPPVVVQQSPEVYVEQAPQSEEPSYWYFCQNPKGYYPYVKQCPNGWMKVEPSPTTPDGEE